tara:strand:+ start:4862 stop:5071 length:210 start_codon:yes stop_codon:yes gene_type:complete
MNRIDPRDDVQIAYPADWRACLGHFTPERLYVLDADHRVYWKTAAGSPGFDPEAWAAAIGNLLNGKDCA